MVKQASLNAPTEVPHSPPQRQTLHSSTSSPPKEPVDNYLLEFFVPATKDYGNHGIHFLVIPKGSNLPSHIPTFLSTTSTITPSRMKQMSSLYPNQTWTWDRLHSNTKIYCLRPLRPLEPFETLNPPFPIDETEEDTEEESDSPDPEPETESYGDFRQYSLRHPRTTPTKSKPSTTSAPPPQGNHRSPTIRPQSLTSEQDLYPIIRASEPGSAAWLVQKRQTEWKARQRAPSLAIKQPVDSSLCSPSVHAEE